MLLGKDALGRIRSRMTVLVGNGVDRRLHRCRELVCCDDAPARDARRGANDGGERIVVWVASERGDKGTSWELGLALR